jgi:hypothetical protein
MTVMQILLVIEGGFQKVAEVKDFILDDDATERSAASLHVCSRQARRVCSLEWNQQKYYPDEKKRAAKKKREYDVRPPTAAAI